MKKAILLAVAIAAGFSCMAQTKPDSAKKPAAYRYYYNVPEDVMIFMLNNLKQYQEKIKYIDPAEISADQKITKEISLERALRRIPQFIQRDSAAIKPPALY